MSPQSRASACSSSPLARREALRRDPKYKRYSQYQSQRSNHCQMHLDPKYKQCIQSQSLRGPTIAKALGAIAIPRQNGNITPKVIEPRLELPTFLDDCSLQGVT